MLSSFLLASHTKRSGHASLARNIKYMCALLHVTSLYSTLRRVYGLFHSVCMHSSHSSLLRLPLVVRRDSGRSCWQAGDSDSELNTLKKPGEQGKSIASRVAAACVHCHAIPWPYRHCCQIHFCQSYRSQAANTSSTSSSLHSQYAVRISRTVWL